MSVIIADYSPLITHVN